MRYSAVLFDLDGTLLDTLDDLHDAVNFALNAQRLPMRTRDEVRAFIGNGIVKLMERSVGREKLASVDMPAVMNDFKQYYIAHCQDKTAPYDGVLPLLKELRNRGMKIGVVSNKADFAVQKLCVAYFGGLIDVAIGENEAGGVRKKPAPDTVLAAIEALGVKRQNTVYVGDSEVDIQTANNAAVDCVSVAWGMKDRGFLLANGAKTVVDNVRELLNCII